MILIDQVSHSYLITHCILGSHLQIAKVSSTFVSHLNIAERPLYVSYEYLKKAGKVFSCTCLLFALQLRILVEQRSQLWDKIAVAFVL